MYKALFSIGDDISEKLCRNEWGWFDRGKFATVYIFLGKKQYKMVFRVKTRGFDWMAARTEICFFLVFVETAISGKVQLQKPALTH